MSLDYKILGQDVTATANPFSYDQYMILGRSGEGVSAKAAYSSDLASWKYGDIPSLGYNAWVTFNQKIFGFTYSSQVVYSEDGITWTLSALPNPAAYAVVGNDKIVVINSYSNESAYSTDGIAWTAITLPASISWSSLAYGNGRFVAAAYNSAIAAYSTNGTAWTQTTLPASTGWNRVVAAEGKGFLVHNRTTDTSAQRVAFSTNGISWTLTTLSSSSAGYRRPFIYGADKFIGIKTWTGQYVYSTNGTVWTNATISSQKTYEWIMYAEDRFVAFENNTAGAAHSTDGITWTQVTTPMSQSISLTGYGSGTFMVASYSGSTMYSTDGIVWTSGPALENSDYNYASSLVVNDIELLSKAQYTVPTSKQAIISSLFVASNSSSSQTYSVAVVPNGEILSSIHYIRKNITIDAKDFNTIDTKITLAEGDQIITESSSTDVVINIFGVEK